MSYDPVPDLAALIDGLHDLAAGASDATLPHLFGHIGDLLTGPYAGLRGGLLLDEPGQEAVTTETALRELIPVPLGDLSRQVRLGLGRPKIVCLCGSTRFYGQYQQEYYDRTMAGEIVLSVGFYPHATAETGHGEGVGHDSDQKIRLDELHLRKIDLADYAVVVSDETGYFGESTAREIRYALEHRKDVQFAVPASFRRACNLGLVPYLPEAADDRS